MERERGEDDGRDDGRERGLVIDNEVGLAYRDGEGVVDGEGRGERRWEREGIGLETAWAGESKVGICGPDPYLFIFGFEGLWLMMVFCGLRI